MGGRGYLPASPETVSLYITDLAGRGLKAATINRRPSAIGQLHQEGKAPILTPTMRRILKVFAAEEGPAAARDRALLLVGLAGGYRVGELAALRAEDVQLVDEGAVVLLRRSKTDQAGGGYYKGIPHGYHPETCPVAHLREWLALVPGEAGPLFRGVDRHGNISGRPMASDSVSRVLKKRARVAKLDLER